MSSIPRKKQDILDQIDNCEVSTTVGEQFRQSLLWDSHGKPFELVIQRRVLNLKHNSINRI